MKNQMNTKSLFTACISMFILCSCNSNYTFKPRGYYKIDFPEKKYQEFNQPGYPFSFEYPTYATIAKDSSFFEEKPENPYWLNIDFPQLSGRIYISYKEVGKNSIDSLVNDAFKMTNKHNQKAYSIDDSAIATPNGIHGIFFKVGGSSFAASRT